MGRHNLGRKGKQNYWMGAVQTDEEFILSRVEVVLNTHCWEWLGSVSNDGYGKCKRYGKTYRAHRLSYEIFRGFIPKDKFVCHHCDNPLCVNPEHLWTGSQKENELDKDKKGRRSPSPTISHPNLIPKGEKHSGSKLTEVQVEAAYLYKLNNPMTKYKDILDILKLPCDETVLSKICVGKSWKYLNLVEKYGKIDTPKGFEYINYYKLGGRPKSA